MRIAALGDAHLGRSYLPYTEGGVNLRELDFERSFEAAVDLALAERPDLVVWLGDVFDHPRPSYRSFRVAQRSLAKLREHGVRAVVITGNHDTPRLAGRGSPYSALADTFAGDVLFAHRLEYERFDLPGLTVHAVPQTMTVDATLEGLRRADRERSLDSTNLLLTHPLLPSMRHARDYADINEIEVDEGELQADLVLLGHWHYFHEVRERVWYAGAPDTFTFADNPERAKGIVVLDTDSGSCQHIPLQGTRPLVTLETIEALGLSHAEVQQQLVARAALVAEGAVARVFVEGVDPEAWRLVDLGAVREAADGALHLSAYPKAVAAALHWQAVELPTLGDRWDAYLQKQDLIGYDRGRVRDLGRDYLAAAVEGAG